MVGCVALNKYMNRKYTISLCLLVGVHITYDRQTDTIARIILLLLLIVIIMVISSRLKGAKNPFGMDVFVSSLIL